MLEKCTELDTYNCSNKLRTAALILTSFIPLFLLFSRVLADSALTIVGILFLIKSIIKNDYEWTKQPISVILLLLWIWFIISSLFAYSSVLKSIGISFVYIRFLLFFFACTNWLFMEVNTLKFASKIITMTLIIAATDSLLQFVTGFSITGKPQLGGRLTSFLGRPDIGIYLAKLIFPTASLWMWLAINEKNYKNILLNCIFLFFIIGIITLTGERTATVLSISALSLILLMIGILNKLLRIYMIFGIFSIISIFILIIYNSPFIHKRAIDFLSDISQFQNSLYGQLFKASILVWQTLGFYAGVGIRQFREACPIFKDSGLVTYCDLHSHNIYLEILSESGIIGLRLFSIFVILCLHKVYQSIKINKHDLGKLISNVYVLGGLFIILFPISVTMSFITNWSGTLNWVGISLCISILQLRITQKYSK